MAAPLVLPHLLDEVLDVLLGGGARLLRASRVAQRHLLRLALALGASRASAPFASKYLTACSLPAPAATWSAVWPWPFRRLTSPACDFSVRTSSQRAACHQEVGGGSGILACFFRAAKKDSFHSRASRTNLRPPTK